MELIVMSPSPYCIFSENYFLLTPLLLGHSKGKKERKKETSKTTNHKGATLNVQAHKTKISI